MATGRDLGDEPKWVCIRCVRETYLQGLIEAMAVGECSYCDEVSAPRMDIEDLAAHVEKAFEAHYERTATDADGYEYAMHNDPEIDYEWSRSGDPVLDVIADVVQCDESIASDVLEILCDQNDHYDPPPGRLARAGRMNSSGISVFYGALEAGSALAEVRPVVGSNVVVAKFDLMHRVQLLDLRALKTLRCSGSIFDPKYALELERHGFLRTLSNRLVLPVMPSDENHEYLITQAVADYLASLHPALLQCELVELADITYSLASGVLCQLARHRAIVSIGRHEAFGLATINITPVQFMGLQKAEEIVESTSRAGPGSVRANFPAKQVVTKELIGRDATLHRIPKQNGKP